MADWRPSHFFVEVSDDEDSNDESCVIDESDCARFLMTKQKMPDHDLPGLNTAYLARDVEDGREVVWNEIRLSEQHRHTQEVKLREILNVLKDVHHENIIKVLDFWTRRILGTTTIIYITENTLQDSLKSVLSRIRINKGPPKLTTMLPWWRQILLGLSHLHEERPPIIHGNLSTSTVFCQFEAETVPKCLIKMRSVGSNALHNAVNNCHDDKRNPVFVAPEYRDGKTITVNADIYSFGICVLEVALGVLPTSCDITREDLWPILQTLHYPRLRTIIWQCLHKDPAQRPSARYLLRELAMLQNEI